MINIPPHLLTVPENPKITMADALRQQTESLKEYTKQQLAKKQEFQQMMQKAMIEQRMKQVAQKQQFAQQMEYLPKLMGAINSGGALPVNQENQPIGGGIQLSPKPQIGSGQQMAGSSIKPVLKEKEPEFIYKPSFSIDPMSGKLRVNVNPLPNPRASLQERKFTAERLEKEQLKEKQSKMVTDAAQETLDTIEKIKSGAKHFGVFGGVPSVPGSKRATWESYTNQLLAKKILNMMNEMKNASRTGATGFGQLSEKELKVLQDSSTALKKTLPQKDALEILNKMEGIARKVLQKDAGGTIKSKTTSGIDFSYKQIGQ